MRVLTAAHYWPPHVGGIESEGRRAVAPARHRGHDVTVVSSRIGNDRALSFDDGFPVHKVAASNLLEDRIRLPYPLFSPRLFSVMSRLARDADVVVAHTHTFMTTVAAAQATRAAGVPFVLIQNNPFIDYRFPLDLVQRAADATIARYTVGAADRLVAISEFTAGYLQRLAPGREVTVMHLGTDGERFSPVDGARRAEIPPPPRAPGRHVGSRSRFAACSTATGSTRCSVPRCASRDKERLHVVIGGTGPEQAEIRDRITADRTRARAARRVHPRRRPGRLLPGRRRVRAPDAHGRGLRPRARWRPRRRGSAPIATDSGSAPRGRRRRRHRPARAARSARGARGGDRTRLYDSPDQLPPR